MTKRRLKVGDKIEIDDDEILLLKKSEVNNQIANSLYGKFIEHYTKSLEDLNDFWRGFKQRNSNKIPVNCSMQISGGNQVRLIKQEKRYFENELRNKILELEIKRLKKRLNK